MRRGPRVYEGEWVRTDDPNVTGVCRDASVLDWRFVPSDPRCALKRFTKAAFLGAARAANISSIFMPGDSVNEYFAVALQALLRDDGKRPRACRPFPGLQEKIAGFRCVQAGDLAIGTQKMYFMCPTNVTERARKWISGDRYVPFWHEWDMVVFNWGAHYGAYGEAMFRAQLASMTRQVAAALFANASARRAPWLVLRSTSAGHPSPSAPPFPPSR